jgi:protein-disulfide isomerase
MLIFELSVNAVAAQISDPATAARLSAIERAILSLEQKVTDLTELLKSALPPGPVSNIAPVTLNIAGAPVKGASSAKIAIIEYSDFECPFCGRHAQATYREIQQQLVETGTVRYVFRHLPLDQIHPNARKAAEAAECAKRQSRFWEVHDRMFANQKMLASDEFLKLLMPEVPDPVAFTTCVSSGAAAEVVNDDVKEARRFDLTGTPAFLLGEFQDDHTIRVTKKIVGAQPFNVFKSAITAIASR